MPAAVLLAATLAVSLLLQAPPCAALDWGPCPKDWFVDTYKGAEPYIDCTVTKVRRVQVRRPVGLPVGLPVGPPPH